MSQAFVRLFIPLSHEQVYLPTAPKAQFQEGDWVLFTDDDNRQEYGKVLSWRESQDLYETGWVVQRKLLPDEEKRIRHLEKEALAITEFAKQKVSACDLPMTILRSDISFDGQMVNISFVSEQRVDFRELLQSLVARLSLSIHLHQIGPRDRARLIGGYASCGREFCCKTVLKQELPSIQLDIIRKQGILHRGAESLSGACGKLKCCMKFEEPYHNNSASSTLPMIGSMIEWIQDGERCRGRIKYYNYTDQTVCVLSDEKTAWTLPLAVVQSE